MPNKLTQKELEDDFVLCRTLGHQWDSNPNFELNTTYNYLLPLRCTRCTTERFDFLNAVGELVSREYRYPENYRSGRIRTVDLRKEMIQRRLWIMRKRG